MTLRTAFQIVMDIASGTDKSVYLVKHIKTAIAIADDFLEGQLAPGAIPDPDEEYVIEEDET